MLKNKAFTLLFYSLFMTIIFPQDERSISLRGYELIKKISRAELMSADTDNLLAKDFFAEYDSIETKYWKNYYWFFFQLQNQPEGIDGRCCTLFAYDSQNKKLKRVIDRVVTTDEVVDSCFSWSNWTSFYEDIYFFNNRLFIIDGFTSTSELGEIGILLIDEKNLKIEKYITICQDAGRDDEYIKNEELYILAQPMKRYLNFWYYSCFWMPRSRGKKWEYEDVGNKILFIYDKNFNLISKKEIPN